MTHAFQVRTVLVLLGILVTSLGLVYFASEFMDRLSDAGIVLSLLLLTVIFVSLGLHFETQPASEPTTWLRIPVALYLLAVVSGIVAAIRFLGMDGLDRIVKVLVVLAVGLGLIFVAARRFGPRAPPRS